MIETLKVEEVSVLKRKKNKKKKFINPLNRKTLNHYEVDEYLNGDGY